MLKKIEFIYKKKLSYILLGIVLILAVFLRLQGVFTKSFPFTYDIGRDLIAAKEIASFSKFPLIGPTTGLSGLFYGPSWYYILGLLYNPLQGDPVLFTAFIELSGVATVFFAYLLGKKISGNFLGLTFAILLSVSSVVQALTMQIWSPDLIPIFWILTLLVIFQIYRKKSSYIYPFLFGILLSLIIDMEIVAGLLFAIGIVISFGFFMRNFFKAKNIILSVLGFLLILSPRIIFDFRHQHILSKAILGLIISKNIGEKSIGFTPADIFDKLKIIFNLWNETVALKNPMLGTVLLILILLLIFFNFKKGSVTLKFFTKVTLVTIIFIIVGILFFGHAIWSHYLVILPLFFLFLVSQAFSFFRESKKYKTIAAVAVILFALFILNPIKIFNDLRAPLWEGDSAVYRNQISTVDYVYRIADKNRFKYIVYTPPVFDYTYEYLFSWYGLKKYGYQPTNKNPKYLFVIMEPDYQDPQRLKDWLSLRKNDGKTISTKRQKGGIIVEERILKTK